MTVQLILSALLMVPMTTTEVQIQKSAAAAPAAIYQLGGDRALRPSKVWDDGWYTYIEWSPDAELPAIFSRGPDGREVLAEGTMLGDHYVLDRIHNQLIFRIDRVVATARRKLPRK